MTQQQLAYKLLVGAALVGGESGIQHVIFYGAVVPIG